MSFDTPVSKASVLIEALPYIQKFRGATFVVKYGGSFMDDPDPESRGRVATDIAFLAACGINVVVVHGGGKAITANMEKAGLKAHFINGMRYTDADSMRIVERTLNEDINRDVCEMIQRRGGNPKGMPGNQILVCQKLVEKDDKGEPVDLGFVGEITSVKTRLIKKALTEGFTPVISPVALDDKGQPHNTNADVAAAGIAASLKARRLIFMSDVPGLLSDPKDPNSLISTLLVGKVEGLKQSGVISKGMIPKVNSAVAALRAGVNRVHFIDGRLPHSLLLEMFTDKGVGTEIVHMIPQAK